MRNSLDLVVPFARLVTYKLSFIPFWSDQRNFLDAGTRNTISHDDFKEKLKLLRPKWNPLFYLGDRFRSVHHCRMRIGCSKLNADLHFNLHVIPDPKCQCGFETESADHYFFHCPQYANQRQVLLGTCGLNQASLHDFLYGSDNLSFEVNKRLFAAVHKFIIDTRSL